MTQLFPHDGFDEIIRQRRFDFGGGDDADVLPDLGQPFQQLPVEFHGGPQTSSPWGLDIRQGLPKK